MIAFLGCPGKAGWDILGIKKQQRQRTAGSINISNDKNYNNKY